MEILELDNIADYEEIFAAKFGIKKNVKLSDLINTEIEKTKFHNLELNSPINICLPSNSDFKSIYFIVENSTSHKFKVRRLHRIHSLTNQEILKIGEIENRKYLVCENIIIDLSLATEIGEINFTNNRDIIDQDENLIKNIIELYQNFELGLITKSELTNQLELHYCLYMNYQNKWFVNNRWQLDGSFYNIKALEEFVRNNNKINTKK